MQCDLWRWPGAWLYSILPCRVSRTRPVMRWPSHRHSVVIPVMTAPPSIRGNAKIISTGVATGFLKLKARAPCEANSLSDASRCTLCSMKLFNSCSCSAVIVAPPCGLRSIFMNRGGAFIPKTLTFEDICFGWASTSFHDVSIFFEVLWSVPTGSAPQQLQGTRCASRMGDAPTSDHCTHSMTHSFTQAC
jgi:hypothetical protein